MWLFWFIVSVIIATLVRAMVWRLLYPGHYYRAIPRPTRSTAMSRRVNHDLVDLPGEIHGETEKAWRFYDGAKTVWLPKSQVEWDEESKTMIVPEWLALDKGLI